MKTDKKFQILIKYLFAGEKDAKKLRKEMDKLDKETKKTKKSTKSMKSSFGSMMGTIAGVTGVIMGLIYAAKKSVEAFMEQEKALRRLKTNLENTSQATEEQYQSLIKLAGQYQNLTTIGDEVTAVGMSQLATYQLNTDQIKKLTPALLDMAAGTYGVNVSQEQMIQSANQLGRALLGLPGQLRRIGISLSDQQAEIMRNGDAWERVNTLVDVVQQNYGGLSQELAKTTVGKITQLNNAFGDLQESLGKFVVPALTSVVDKLTDIVEYWNKVLKIGGRGGAKAISQNSLTSLSKYVNKYKEELKNLKVANEDYDNAYQMYMARIMKYNKEWQKETKKTTMKVAGQTYKDINVRKTEKDYEKLDSSIKKEEEALVTVLKKKLGIEAKITEEKEKQNQTVKKTQEQIKKERQLQDKKMQWMYEQNQISYEQYKAHLEKRYKEAEGNAEKQFELRKEITKLEQEQAAKEEQIIDNKYKYMYENQEISKEEYKQYLQTQLNEYKKYSSEWMQIHDKLQDLESNKGDTSDPLNRTRQEVSKIMSQSSSGELLSGDLKKYNQLNDLLQQLKANGKGAGVAARYVKQQMSDVQPTIDFSNALYTLTDSFTTFIAETQSFGQAMRNMGEVVRDLAVNILNVFEQQLIAALGLKKAMKALLGPFDQIGTIIAGIVLIEGIKAGLKSMSFAEGGFVTEPTLALAAEAGDAKKHGEVFAPKNKLQTVMNELVDKALKQGSGRSGQEIHVHYQSPIPVADSEEQAKEVIEKVSKYIKKQEENEL